jgi:tRNA threonylcarbamoyladenosine biosynthesis protein TsaB
MHLIALDTTRRAGSLAILEDDHVIAEQQIDQARSYAEELPDAIVRLVNAARRELSAIDVFAVAAGPGSFTGLRIGIATIQGLAFVNNRRVVAVSALEALAHACSGSLSPGSVIGVWMDARRGDVFSALYQVADAPLFTSDRFIELEPPSTSRPAATLARWSPFAPALLVGDGAILYEAVVGTATLVEAGPPIASTIGRIAVERARTGQTVSPGNVQPLYVRRPDAEIARDLAAEGSQLNSRRADGLVAD